MCENSKNKINCQCDGNCDCGKILPNGMISCDNCGWEAKEKYNAITGRFTCPSCRTEKLNLDYYSNYSNNSNKNNQMTNNDNFTQGLVGFATANPGFLDWSKNPIGKPNGNTESNFADNVSSQNVVGYAIGQQWMPMDPIHGQEITESGYTFGEKLKGAFVRFTPHGILVRQSFCGKYCKALGYARKGEGNAAFKKCIAACKINYINARNGKWKYPAAPEGMEATSISPEDLAAASEREVTSMPKDQVDAAARNVASQEGSTPIVQPEKNNTMMYVIIGVVALVIVVALIMFMRRKAVAA